MHELSIAQEIFNIVEQYLPDENAAVSQVNVKIGKLSNIVVESLIFCFDAIKPDTILKDTRLNVEEIPITVKCNNCNKVNELEYFNIYCKSCGSTNTTLIAGNELNVTEIELKD